MQINITLYLQRIPPLSLSLSLSICVNPGCHIARATKFVRWHLIFVDSQNGGRFMHACARARARTHTSRTRLLLDEGE